MKKDDLKDRVDIEGKFPIPRGVLTPSQEGAPAQKAMFRQQSPIAPPIQRSTRMKVLRGVT